MKVLPSVASVVLLIAALTACADNTDLADPAKALQPPPGAIGYPDRRPDMDVRPGFANPPPGYGEVPFYWWLGDQLTKPRLKWQIEQLAGRAVMGLQINYAHSDRGGRLWGLTYPSDPPLFSQAWWDLCSWFMQEAKKHGMAVSLSDYTLGIGQGWYMDEILKETPSLYGSTLASNTRIVAGGAEVSWELPQGVVSVVAYRMKENAIDTASPGIDLRKRLSGTTLLWSPPAEAGGGAGRWQIVAVSAKVNPNSIDPMNPLSGPKVIEKFFQRFEDRNPGEGGKGLNFFFSDELDFGVHGNLWTANFADEFSKRKGYDLLAELPALFIDCGPRTPKVRMDYRDVMVTLQEEGFFKPVHEWHVKRGMIYGCDHGGRGRNVAEFGDYFRTQRWMSGPGCDQPGLAADVVKNKVASSIAHLYLRPRTWLEGYHSSGWGTNTAQLADATFRNFVMGQNLLTLHGLYYSTHGGWWEWAPPCNHFRMPYWAHAEQFMHCFQRLSYLLSQGHHRCDWAIVYPVAPMEAGLGGNEAVSTAFGAGDRMYKDGIDFDFMDFQSLTRAQIQDKQLAVSGEAYRVLVLPAMRAVRYSTIQKALEFYRAGGIVVALGALPQASDRIGSDDAQLDAMVLEIFGASAREPIKELKVQRTAAGGLGVLAPTIESAAAEVAKVFPRDFAALTPNAHPYILHRKIGPRDVFMVYGAAKDSECFFRAKGSLELWDPWTGQSRPLFTASTNADGTTVRMPLDATEPQIIVFTPSQPRALVQKTDLDEVAAADLNNNTVTITGFAATPGTKTASVLVGGKTITLSADAAAPPQPMPLDGEWGFALKPTLDNQWGDYRWPAFAGFIGAEARQFRYADEVTANPKWHDPKLDDSKWSSVTSSFGQRFWKLGPLPADVDAAAIEKQLAGLGQIDPALAVDLGGKKYRWQPYVFSMRYGVEGDPGREGYHGLKELVNDDFIALGKRTNSAKDTKYTEEPGGKRYYLWTAAWSADARQARIVAGGMKPAGVWINNVPVANLSKPIAIKTGANPLLLRYDQPGRAHFLIDTDLAVAGAEADDPSIFTAAQYIWYPGDAPAQSDRFFRNTFKVNSKPAKAVLRVACDNAYTLFLNGKQVGQGNQWNRVQQYDLALALKVDDNVLAIAAHNDGGDAGLIAELTVTSDQRQVQRVATDASWRCKKTESAGWREMAFNDSTWSQAAVVSNFADSLWAKHQNGPPRLDAPVQSGQQEIFKTSPLAMTWHARTTLLPFDIRPTDATPAGWYRFTAPPALRSMVILAYGKVGAWVDGKEIQVTPVERRDGGLVLYKGVVAQPIAGTAKVAVRIEQSRGNYGGAALAEPITLDCAQGTIALGDWSTIDGLASYSGGAWYRKTITLNAAQAASQVTLDLGNLTASAEVHVNGQPAGIKSAPPFAVEISRLVKPGENRIEVLVYNTLANHYLTIPTRYRGSPVSGLLGPVRLEFCTPVTMSGP